MRKLAILFSLLFALPSLAQQVTPSHQGHVTQTQPTIRADFNTRIRSARIWVDGQEFTGQARTRGESVTLVPPYPLDYGVHQVQVVTDDGRQANWNFAIVAPNNQAGYNNQPGYNPHPNQPYNPGYNQPGYRSPYTNQPNYYPGYNNGRPSGITDVRNYGPAAGSVVTVQKPAISAAFNGPVNNLRLIVDGRDVTGESIIGNEGITWTPRHNLDQGQHNAQVTGTSANTGQPVSGNWNFTVRKE